MGYIRETSKKHVRSIMTVLAGVLCAALLVLFDATEVLAAGIGTVTASSANVRSEASTSSSVVAGVVNGDKLEIVEEVTGSDGKTWYKVVVNADSTGYIRADLVKKEEGSAAGGTETNAGATVNTEGVSAVQPVSASVVRDQVRVRADSSTNSSIVTMVQEAAVLTVQGTKPGNGDEVWYLVSFVSEGEEVTGYVRSDFVTLSGELLPVVEQPADTPTEPVPVTPDVPVEEPKFYDTKDVDGVWYLLDNNAGEQYKISELISGAEQNAEELEKAQKQLSKQNGIIIFLAILVVVMVLGITLLIFKIRDMKEDEGFDELPVRRPAGSGSRPVRPAGSTNRQPASRPAGTRPAGSHGTNPARPAGSQSVKPAGTRPVSSGSAEGKPATTAGTGTRPTARPASGATAAGSGKPAVKPDPQRPVAKGENTKPETQPKAHVKNFMSDEDEFEFEFLNWDGEEEK